MIASGAKLCIFTDSLLLRAPPTSPMETSTWDSPIDRVNNLWYGVASTQLKLFWPEWATYLKFVPSTRMDQDWQDRALPGREFLSRQPQTRQCVVPNQHRGVALRGMASIRHFRWYTGRGDFWFCKKTVAESLIISKFFMFNFWPDSAKWKFVTYRNRLSVSVSVWLSVHVCLSILLHYLS